MFSAEALLIWIIVEHEPTVIAIHVGVGGGSFDFFSPL